MTKKTNSKNKTNKNRKFIRENKQEMNKAKNQGNQMVQQLTKQDMAIYNRITDVRNAMSTEISGANETIAAIDRVSNQFYIDYQKDKKEMTELISSVEKKFEVLIDIMLEIYPNDLEKEQIEILGLVEETEEKEQPESKEQKIDDSKVVEVEKTKKVPKKQDKPVSVEAKA